MTEAEARILVVEDDEATAELERRSLARAGLLVQTVYRLNAAVALLKEQRFDAIVVDYNLPDGEPWPLIEAANRKIPRIPVIMVTAQGSEGVAVEALHRGVSDYVMKAEGFLGELPKTIRKVIEAATAEESLHVSDKLLQLIAGNLSDVILVADLSGVATYISPACQSVLGYQPQELKAALTLELIHPDDRESVARLLANIEQQGQNSLIYRCRAKQGDFRWIESNVNLLHDPATGSAQVIAISRDVTERKNAENEIKRLNRAKSDFLAAMSHEIRTPLNAILGMGDLLKDTELTALQRDYVERGRRAGSGLLTLINDILDLSKIESGHFDLEQIPFNLVDLVTKAAELLAPKANLKGIGLFTNIAPQTPVRLIGDPVRLQQILLNLLSNALKFTEHGEIALTVAPHSSRQPGRLQFEVRDTGVGIPETKFASIFEDFTQAESSTTRRFGGTGLGLGIARRLVHCMHGKLTVRSVLDEGSTFSFDAVFAINEEPEMFRLVSIMAPPRKVAKTPANILIAEDSEDNRFLLQAYLADQPYHLKFVENGQDALSAFEIEKFDLILMDVHMPIMDGLMAAESMRAFERQDDRPRTPILALTADALLGDAERSQAAGCDGHLAKPTSKAALIAAIENTCAAARTGH